MGNCWFVFHFTLALALPLGSIANCITLKGNAPLPCGAAGRFAGRRHALNR